LRKYFTAGLAALLPLFLTGAIVSFLINFLTNPFLHETEFFLEKLHLSPLFEYPGFWMNVVSKIVILALLLGGIIFVGFIGNHFIMRNLFLQGDLLLSKIPYINKLYRTSQDLVHSLFSDKSASFTRVVFIPFPNQERLNIGFVTNQEIPLRLPDGSFKDMTPIFVPGAPNPTGYLLFCQKEKVHSSPMKVDEAMRFIVSCGINLQG
jgi:uncharacterized membrane protein